MSEVVRFYPKDAAKSADAVLEQSVGVFDDVLVLGVDKDGDLDVRATLGLDLKEIIWLVESFKHNLLSGVYDE